MTVQAEPTVGRLAAAALAALTAGQPAEARRQVQDALRGEIDLVARAELVRLRARLSTWSGPVDAAAWTEVVEVAERVISRDAELAAALLCDAAVLAAYTRQLPLAEQLAGRALALTGGEGIVGAWAATGLGIACGLTGRGEQAAPLLARAEELFDADRGLVDAAELLLPGVLALMVQERYDDAVEAAGRFLRAARPLGAVGLLPLPLCLLAHAGWKAGRWEEARLAAAEALPLATGSGEVALELYAQAMLALVAGGQGRADVCRQRAARALDLSDSTGIGMFRVTAHMSLVHLALGDQRPADALAPLAEVDRLLAGQRRSGMLNWHADHVDVLVQLGQRDQAEAVVAALGDAAADNRWEAAALLRCVGQLEPDDAAAVTHLSGSVEAFAFQPYEQARSRLRLAERLLRHEPERAQEQARRAHAAFTALRARGWAAQAQALLAAPPAVPLVVPSVVPDTIPPVPAPGGLELRLLGGCAVLCDGRPLPLTAGTGLLAVKYVAVRGGRVPVDELVEVLWPDAEPGRGRARLRNVLARLRQDADLLTRAGDDVVLADAVLCDATAFEREATLALADGDLEQARRAVARYEGELLPGDRYQDWTSAPRERLRGRYLQLLDRLAEAAAGSDVDEALEWWERAVGVEPYDEDRYVAMARLLLERGRSGPARRVVRRASSMLDRLGVAPSPTLRALAARVGA